MVPDDEWYLFPREKWKKNYIPFAGYLAMKYGAERSAWRVIMNRYVRMKKIVWPDEFKEFGRLFWEKHPEFRSSRVVSGDISLYSYQGAYWNKGWVSPVFLGYSCLFDIEPPSKSILPEEQDTYLINRFFWELNKIKKGAKK